MQGKISQGKTKQDDPRLDKNGWVQPIQNNKPIIPQHLYAGECERVERAGKEK